MALIKLIEQDLPASQMLFMRGIMVVGGVSVILAAFGRLTPTRLRANRPSFFAINAVFWSLGSVAFYKAIQLADFAILNAVLLLGPLVSLIMARLLLGERITRLQQIGILIAFSGVLFCVVPSIESTQGALLLGITLAALRMMANSTGRVIGRYLAQRETIEVYMIFANLFSIPMALIGLLFEDWIALDQRSLLCVGGFGAIQILATFLGAVGMRNVPAAISSSIGYLQLPVAVGIAWLVFNEIPGPFFYIGAAVLIGGLSLASGLWRPAFGRKAGTTPIPPSFHTPLPGKEAS
jgi:drug/metabolite transporter (DMT)-like permease